MSTPSNINNKETSTFKISALTREQLAANRNLIPIAFAAVLILFFFRFCSIQILGGFLSITGFNCITGVEPQVPSNSWAILAFAAAITGLAVFVRKEKKEARIGAIAAIVGFIALLFLRSSLKSLFQKTGGGIFQLDLSFQLPYWLALLSFVIAGGICFLRLQSKAPEMKKPETKGITPLHINIITQDAEEQKTE